MIVLVIFATLTLFMEGMIAISDRRIFFEEKTLQWECVDPATISCQKVMQFQSDAVNPIKVLTNTNL